MPASPNRQTGPVRTLHDVAMAAELCLLWSAQSGEALEGFAASAQEALQDATAGREVDLAQLYMRYGAARALLDQVAERLELAGEALGDLRVGLIYTEKDVSQEPESGASVLPFRKE